MKTDAEAHLFAKWIEALEKGEVSLEDSKTGRTDLPEETVRLLQLAAELRSQPPIGLGEEFRRSARARLLRKISLAAPTRPRAARHLRRPTFHPLPPAARVFAVAALLLVFMTTGTVYASTYALPGDFAYPVKGWVERVRLQMAPAGSDEALYRGYVQERAAEIQALIERERYADLPVAFDQIEKQVGAWDANQGSKDHVRTLQAELSKQGEVLNSLLESVPEDARPAIEQALSASSRSQERLSGLTGDTPQGDPPGQKKKDHPAVPPPLPSQAKPNADSQPTPESTLPVQTTPEPEISAEETPTFVPPGQEKKEKDKEASSQPLRGSQALTGRGQKGKPTWAAGHPSLRSTRTPPTP